MIRLRWPCSLVVCWLMEEILVQFYGDMSTPSTPPPLYSRHCRHIIQQRRIGNFVEEMKNYQLISVIIPSRVKRRPNYDYIRRIIVFLR